MTSRDDSAGPEEKEGLLWNVVRNLNHQCVPHIVIGGNAVRRYVAEREPHDLDVWVRPGPENAARVADALIYSGFDYEDVTGSLHAFMSDKGSARLLHPESGIHLDVLRDVSGSEMFGGFDEAYKNAAVAMVGGEEYRYLDAHRLTVNKIASWSEEREKDMNDARSLLDRDRELINDRDQKIAAYSGMVRGLFDAIGGQGRQADPEPEKRREPAPERERDRDWGHER